MTRAEIARWPRGHLPRSPTTSTATAFATSRSRSRSRSPSRGGHLTGRLDGLVAAGEGRAQLHALLHQVLHLSVACAACCDRTCPNNAGVFRCIDVIAPEGTILNPRLPGAGRGARADRLPHDRRDARRARPDRARPRAGGRRGRQHRASASAAIDGRPPPFVIVDMISGAWGGRPDKDGIEAITNPSQNMSNTPVEVLEAQHPVRIEEYGFVPDSCGRRPLPRRPRPARARYRLLADEAMLQLRSDRRRFRPYGLAGGEPAAASAERARPGRRGARRCRQVHHDDPPGRRRPPRAARRRRPWRPARARRST